MQETKRSGFELTAVQEEHDCLPGACLSCESFQQPRLAYTGNAVNETDRRHRRFQRLRQKSKLFAAADKRLRRVECEGISNGPSIRHIPPPFAFSKRAFMRRETGPRLHLTVQPWS